MVGAQSGLTVKPTKLAANERPEALRGCPGDVFRLDEQVIDAVTLVDALATPVLPNVLRIDGERGLSFERSDAGNVTAIHLTSPGGSAQLTLRPSAVLLTAGNGNERLREQIGLPGNAMQRRPLHMVMLRGHLPTLNGHCVDGAKTRLTITTARDHTGRAVWQLGGQIAEDGVSVDRDQLIDLAARELMEVLPGFDVGRVDWGTYRVDRAEAQNDGRRPEDATINVEGNVLTAWPTKLVLAPILAERLRQQVDLLAAERVEQRTAPPLDWPRPDVALPPWEIESNWNSGR
jgi:glycerol-3-phosphate dehydrogenase